jgi:WD repeat-containing protein 35
MKLGIQNPTSSNMGSNAIVGLHWYNGKHGYVEPGCPVLAICFTTGQLFLLRDENDEGRKSISILVGHLRFFLLGIVIDTFMNNSCCQWNHNGSILAIAGTIPCPDETEPASNALQLFTPFGEVSIILLTLHKMYIFTCFSYGQQRP